jgi:hypothetical protein
MSKTITIYYDDQAGVDAGWAYRIDGGDSGAIDGAAADAIRRICEGVEAHDDDYRDMRAAVGYSNGDDCILSVGGGAHIDMEPLLTNY